LLRPWFKEPQKLTPVAWSDSMRGHICPSLCVKLGYPISHKKGSIGPGALQLRHVIRLVMAGRTQLSARLVHIWPPRCGLKFNRNDESAMKVVILAGGLGTRISEETHLKPKPMIEIGGKPILWHIMKIYSAHGIDEFVICCGYKGYVIK